MGMHFIGLYLMGVPLIDVYFMDLHIPGPYWPPHSSLTVSFCSFLHSTVSTHCEPEYLIDSPWSEGGLYPVHEGVTIK
jgi:hypothetical protein